MTTLVSLNTALTAVLAQAGAGRIVGGWEYVWVSYGLTWAVMTFYGLSLWLRAHAENVANANDEETR